MFIVYAWCNLMNINHYLPGLGIEASHVSYNVNYLGPYIFNIHEHIQLGEFRF